MDRKSSVLIACVLFNTLIPIKAANALTMPAPGAIVLRVTDLPGFPYWASTSSGNGTAWNAQFRWDPTLNGKITSNGAGNEVLVTVSPFPTIQQAKAFYNGVIVLKPNWMPAGIGDQEAGGHGGQEFVTGYNIRFRRRDVVVDLTVEGPTKKAGAKSSGINPTIVANLARIMDHRIQRLTH